MQQAVCNELECKMNDDHNYYLLVEARVGMYEHVILTPLGCWDKLLLLLLCCLTLSQLQLDH